MATMKLRISIIGTLTIAMLATLGCAKEEKSRFRNKNREAAYQQRMLPPVASGPNDDGSLAPIAEPPPGGTVWGRNLGAY